MRRKAGISREKIKKKLRERQREKNQARSKNKLKKVRREIRIQGKNEERPKNREKKLGLNLGGHLYLVIAFHTTHESRLDILGFLRNADCEKLLIGDELFRQVLAFVLDSPFKRK